MNNKISGMVVGASSLLKFKVSGNSVHSYACETDKYQERYERKLNSLFGIIFMKSVMFFIIPLVAVVVFIGILIIDLVLK